MMTFRQTIRTAILCFITPVLCAGTLGDSGYNDTNGVYLGAAIGVADLIDSQSSPPTTHQFSATGISGGGLVGYDSSWYGLVRLGLEGFINANGLKVSASTPNNAYTVTQSYATGVRLLPGYELTSGIVGHVLLGYVNAKFSIQDNGDYGYINQSVNQSGFQSGLGMTVALSTQISLRTDLSYTTYGTLASIGGSNNPSVIYQSYSNRLSNIEGDLTLVYQFI